MPYRAPELFDVKTGSTLDERVDIWVRIRFLNNSMPPSVHILSRSCLSLSR